MPKEELQPELQPEVHACGSCGTEFGTEAEYLEHTCEATGYKPTDIEHQDALTDGRFSQQSENALARGEARKSEAE